ncbi:hypothetical protein N0V94_002295 [Neodidymelliopsis sp. IMI 364377]|nr:hypothetical protein N0V94_002295 [Neodidymelliopsis sp. IMI 364377]
MPDAKAEAEHDLSSSLDRNGASDKESSRRTTLHALELGPPKHHSNAPPASHRDIVTIVNNIIDRVTTMSEESPDRLRGLEIAEALLNTVEYSREARISAETAKKHASDAELNAERAGLEMQRLLELCESELDNETLQALKLLIVDELPEFPGPARNGSKSRIEV